MRPFKFLRTPLFTAHDGGDVYVGEVFYTMNKEELQSVVPGRIIPKYTIVTRCIHPKYKNRFKPDYDSLWYFRSESNANYLKDIWEWQDNQTNGGEIFNEQADIRIIFNR